MRLEWCTHVAPVLTDYIGRMMQAGYDETFRLKTLEQLLKLIGWLRKTRKGPYLSIDTKPGSKQKEERKNSKFPGTGKTHGQLFWQMPS